MDETSDTTGKWDIFVRFDARIRAIDWWNRSRNWKELVALVRRWGDVHPLHVAPDTWAPLMAGKVVTLWGASWSTMYCLTAGSMRRSGLLAVAVPSLFEGDLPPLAGVVIPPLGGFAPRL